MGYFQVRYDSRVVNYDLRGFIRLPSALCGCHLGLAKQKWTSLLKRNPPVTAEAYYNYGPL